mmetsp:Transcript_13475/g.33015  ORF Transcript_13475/g.33015 Transcript_13475/m.33015 type:complete len:238 (-) Transcript_13475:3774-4487(-)
MRRSEADACGPVSSTSLLNMDQGTRSRLSGVSNSLSSPLAMARILSEKMMVSRRWAMVMVVRPLNTRRMVFWMRLSVCRSMAAVASSSTRMRVFLSTQRAMHTSCFWPSEKLEPPSATAASRPPGSSDTASFMCTSSRACHTSLSVESPKGSRLERTVPLNMTGSWGMMARRLRTSRSGTLAMFLPSITMRPMASSNMRNSAMSSVVLPEPVRPTTPTFSQSWMWKVTNLSARGAPG